MKDKIYIDFKAGMHGFFLGYLIYRFVLKDPAFQSSLPFNDIGTSHSILHLKPVPEERKVIPFPANIKDCIPTDINDLVVKINWDASDLYVQMYNEYYRSGKGIPFSERKSAWFWDKNSNATVRNFLFTRFIDPEVKFNYYNSIYTVQNLKTDVPVYEFNFKSFFDVNVLLSELLGICKSVEISTDISLLELKTVWDSFILNSGGFYSLQSLNNIFLALVNDNNLSLEHLLIPEEAYLNKLITENFDIHSDLSVFNKDTYPENLLDITKEIKQILKNRNHEFDLDKPIADQWDRVRRLH